MGTDLLPMQSDLQSVARKSVSQKTGVTAEAAVVTSLSVVRRTIKALIQKYYVYVQGHSVRTFSVRGL